MSFPEDSVQHYSEEWWVQHELKGPWQRGELVWATLPHTHVVPYVLEPTRGKPDEHRTFEGKLMRLTTGQARGKSPPVAALPKGEGDHWLVTPAKRRPCVLISTGAAKLEREITHGMSGYQHLPMFTAIPYYGADKSGTRGGYPDAFVERVRHADFPNFIFEQLPIAGSKVSIGRVDHMKPVGADAQAVTRTGWRLGEDALAVYDEWVDWYRTGILDADSELSLIRDEFNEYRK